MRSTPSDVTSSKSFNCIYRLVVPPLGLGDWAYDRWVTMSSVAMDRVALAPAVALFGSLADPTRLAIVRELADAPARVVDLTGRLGLAQSTVSQHLACLRDCGLVSVHPVGRSSVYSLAQPTLNDLLSAAETVLADTGNAVALCPTYGAAQEDS
jgi:DNA-binding transcriptional ArsR family regulator